MFGVAWFYFQDRKCTQKIDSYIENRVVCQFTTSKRTASATRSDTRREVGSVGHTEVVVGHLEHDSHADTIVLGQNAIILGYTGRECEVSPYTDQYESIKGVPIVRGATGYTDPKTGERYILVFNEALWMGDQLKHSLFNPNQLRHFGCLVEDNPYSGNVMSITSPESNVVIPMESEGTTLYVNTWTPTQSDLSSFPHVVMSSPHEWEPRSVQFPKPSQSVKEEFNMRNASAVVREVFDNNGIQHNGYDNDDEFDSERECVFDIGQFSQRIISSARVYSTPVMTRPEEKLIQHISKVEVSEGKSDITLPRTFQTKGRHSDVSPQDLSERWGISVAQAALTLKATTQKYMRSALMPLSRRYRVDRYFQKKTFKAHVYTDTMDARVKSIDGNRYGQVFATKDFFCEIYPMATKDLAGEGLRQFMADYGVMEALTFDGSKEQTKHSTTFMKQIRKENVDYHISEPHRPNQNDAEGVIRELRRKWFRVMLKKRIPRRLWDYGCRWVAETMRNTASHAGKLCGRTPAEKVTGDTPDISENLDFGIYDWVWYRENAGLGETMLGRWLGVSHRTGGLMCYWILPMSGIPVSRTSVQRVTNLEMQTVENIARITEFDAAIKRKFKEDDDLGMEGAKPNPDDWSDYIQWDPDFAEEFQNVIDDKLVPEVAETWTPDSYDTYLNMELALDRGDEQPSYAKVTKRMKDKDGNPIGTANENPILDSRIYEVEYEDGFKTSLAANVIAESLFAQVDQEGHRHVLFSEIVEHRTDGTELKQVDAFIENKHGNRRRRETTKGWEILVRWKDGSTTWVVLKDMKNSYPVQLAEYAVENKISEEPAFAWWAPYVLKKRNRILAKIKSKYWVRTHKFGIEIPKSVSQAIAIDKKNGNTLWWDAIVKEMKNVRPAFDPFEGKESDIPIGYQRIDCHMIFDIKMGENFRRKARLVAGGHTTDTPAALTYSSVVSRDSVRIALTIAALNDLKILACDIQNAYLTAKCRELIWTVAGPEFGSEQGKIMIVVQALYGLKSSGAAFRSLLAETLRDLSYEPSQADPDVWMRPAVKPDGFEYWEYVLCYVDDLLSISHDPLKTMHGVQNKFKLKDDKIAEPDVYLGATLSKMQTADGKMCWTMSSDAYCQAAVKNVECTLERENKSLPTKCFNPMVSNYKPELDVSAELKADGVQYYQELIGVLRWAVEIGRCDILLETCLLSAHLALPRIGHLEQVIHIFGYLKAHPKRKLAFDSLHPMIDESRFQKREWEDFYKDAKEAIPVVRPEERGNPVSMHCFEDAGHANDELNRRSQTGILIFVNRAPILWHSKRQNSVETSTFGSEFTALKTAVELVEALRYKLRMFGVPLTGPTNVYCDNEAVFKNASNPTSVLRKKHHSISYHRCREACAAGTIRIAKEGTLTNLSDIFTKIMSAATRNRLVDMFMY